MGLGSKQWDFFNIIVTYCEQPKKLKISTNSRNICTADCGVIRLEKKLTDFLNERTDYENMIKK